MFREMRRVKRTFAIRFTISHRFSGAQHDLDGNWNYICGICGLFLLLD